MPLALIIAGLVLVITGARGTNRQLRDLLVSDFSGQGNFMTWIVAIGVVGMLGYVPQLEKFSRVFLALVLISMILAHRGFIAKFQEAMAANRAAAPSGGSATSTDAPAATSSGGIGGAVTGAVTGAAGWVGNRLWENSLPGIVSGMFGGR